MAGEGTLLDTLVVRITVDLSGFHAGIAQAIREVQGFKAAVVGSFGGVTLGDAMTAALVTPMVVATARIGQLRNEVRLLTTELRAAALLPAGGGSRGALVPFVAGASGAMILDATQGNQARGPRGRYTRGASYSRVESDDLSAATRMGPQAPEGMRWEPRHEGGQYIPIGGFWDRHYQDIDERANPPRNMREARERGEPEPRRRRNWFERTFSPSRAARAFDVGQREFPGYHDAVDNLGGSAHSVGQAGRRMAGSRIAQMFGLVGMGALFGDLLKVAASLATVIGSTLAGAFAALLTPIGAVVAALAALVALFVAANWEGFKQFGEWVQSRFVAVVGPAWTDLMIALGEAWKAFVDLFNTLWNDEGGLKNALQELGEVAAPIFALLAEIVLRAMAAIVQALTAIVRTITEVVRTITALLRGDWEAAWEHAKGIVGELFRGVIEIVVAFLPELEGHLRGIGGAIMEFVGGAATAAADWVGTKFAEIGAAAQQLWSQITGLFGGGNGGAKSGFRGGAKSGFGDDKATGIFAANDNAGGGVFSSREISPQLERMTRLAEDFGVTIAGALERAADRTAKLSIIVRELTVDLARLVFRATVIEPLANWISNVVKGVFTGGGGGSGSSGGDAPGGGSSNFAGFFAKGGYIPPGQWGWTGEEGPERIYGGRTGVTVEPANDRMVIDARTFIDAKGADSAAIARLEAAAARRDRELPANIKAQIGNYFSRRT